MAANEQNMNVANMSRQEAMQRLGAIQQIMQTYQPGAWAQQKAEIVAKAKSLGLPVEGTSGADPASYEEFVKNATRNVFTDLKDVGGRPLVASIQGLSKSTANPELQPAANAAIISQARGILDFENQHYNDYVDWKLKNPNATTDLGFQRNWVRDNHLQDFVSKEDKDFAYAGQKIPPKEQLEDGRAYMTSLGPGRWDTKNQQYVRIKQ